MKFHYSVIILFILTAISIKSYSQIGANSIYADRYRNMSDNTKKSIVSTDSTFTINVNILLNKEADRYKLIMGAMQTGATPKEGLEKINKTITAFKTKVLALGISEGDIYVDFVSQTKVYDFIKQDTRTLKQVEGGFEVRKNIIINLTRLDDIEKIILLASDNDIYNVVNVEYINDNLEAIHSQLLKEAFIIEAKKAKEYIDFNKVKAIGFPVVNETYYTVFPKERYQSFTAYESSEYDRYSSENKLLARKDKTYYYEGMNYSGFDKVIGNNSPQIGIQYVLSLSVTHKVQKH